MRQIKPGLFKILQIVVHVQVEARFRSAGARIYNGVHIPMLSLAQYQAPGTAGRGGHSWKPAHFGGCREA